MYLLIYRSGKHLFSFYINSAKKKIVIGGVEGDILFPPEMSGYELSLRREFDFHSKTYVWTLYPSSKGFSCNGKDVAPGDQFNDKDVVSIRDFAFSFSHHSHLVYTPQPGEGGGIGGGTVLIDNIRKEYKNILIEYDGDSKNFTFREGREIKIGRRKCDIVLAHPEVSTDHFVLVMKKNAIYFWNHGKNGTFANGIKVENGELHDGKHRFLIAGKYPLTISIQKENTAEAFYKGLLAPHFEQIENWIHQPDLFASHPIILLTGESGVGKEVFAEFTHDISNRAGEFVTFNAAAIPENLAESELFGTCKGGFTGAEERAGAFLQADGGTLFLDEIAEMPLNLQSKLLRVLEDWTVRRVGETGPGRKVNTMVILATNRNLEKEIEAGRFRRDLYYRLSTLHIHIPPLRERADDILPLAQHLHYSLRGIELAFDFEAARKLCEYSWPGNVRELKSVMTKFAYRNKVLFEVSDASF